MGFPPHLLGSTRLKVVIRIGVDGSVGLRATLNDQSLPVTLLTEEYPKIPLTFRVPTIPIDQLVNTPCPECKRSFVVRNINWKQEPFALCLDCGHHFEIPNSFSSTGTAPWEDLPPELAHTMGIESPHTPGGLTPEEIQELEARGFDFFIKDEPDLKIGVDDVVQQIPGMFFQPTKKDELNSRRYITPGW